MIFWNRKGAYDGKTLMRRVPVRPAVSASISACVVWSVFFFHQLELTGQCRLCDMDLARCLIEAPRLDDRNEIFVKFQIQVNSPLFY